MTETHSLPPKRPRCKLKRCHAIESLEARMLLTAITWISNTSGDFATASDWSTGTVPGPGDDVTINQGAGVTVTVFSGETPEINSLTTNSPVVVTGKLTVDSGSVTLTGTTLEADSSGGQGDVMLGGAASLNGTGTVTIDGAGEIDPTGTGLTIASGITIAEGGSASAFGLVGNPSFSDIPVINNGAIDAGILDLQMADLINNGTLNAADGGQLTINGPCTLNANSNVNIGIDIDGAGTLTLASSASLAGNLNIALDNGFIPTQGMQYTVVANTGQNLTGAFAAVNGPASSSLTFTPTTTSAGITVTVGKGASTGSAAATIGGLDPAFASGGLASHSVGLSSTSDLLLQPDGKSVIIGTAGTSPAEKFGLTRYNADGSLDDSFGNSGFAHVRPGGDDVAAAGFLLPDGDILVAGTDTTFTSGSPAGSQFALAEFTPAGALDTTFGGGAGFVLTSFSTTAGTLSNDAAHAITVSSSGEIFVAGSSDAAGRGEDFAIAAYNSDGSPVSTFGNNGQVLLDFTGGDDSIASLALGAKGTLLAAGSTTDLTTGVGSVALADFLANGALNTHFGTKGKIITSVGGIDDAAASVVFDSKGRIVAGGSSATGSASAGTLSSDFLVLRYTSAGKLDRSFNHNGTAITSFSQPAAVTRVVANADGTIIASGKTATTLNSLNIAELDLAVARYTSTGQPDTSFNHTGQAVFNLSATTGQALNSATSAPEQPAKVSPLDSTAELMMEFDQFNASNQGVVATTPGGELLDVGNDDANTVEAAIITMGIDLAASILSTFPAAVVGGSKGTISIKVAEGGNELAAGAVTLELSAAQSANAPAQPSFETFSEKLNLKENQSKTFKLKFSFPTSLANGNYFVQATVDTGSVRDLDAANNTAASAAAVDIAMPFIDLAGSGLAAPVFTGTKPANISFTVTNNGNIPTPSTASTTQFLVSPDGTLASATPISSTAFKPNLKPSTSRVFRSKVALPSSLSPGTYFLLVLIDPANVFDDVNTSNNLIVSSSSFAIG